MATRTEERQNLLEQYLRRCVQDNVFSLADLLSFDTFDKLLSAASGDLRVVLARMGRQTGRSALRGLGAALMSMGGGPPAEEKKR